MVQRIGRQFPELEVGGSSPPGSAHGTDLAGAGGSPQNCRWPVRLRPVSLRCSRCGRPGMAGSRASRSSPVIHFLMERLRVRVLSARRLAVAQLAEHLTRCAPPHSPAFLSSPAAVTALAVRARVEDRRLPVWKTVLPGGRYHIRAVHRRRGRAGRRRPVIWPRRFESCSGRRIPHPPGPPPPTPPQHPPGDRRTEPEDR